MIDEDTLDFFIRFEQLEHAVTELERKLRFYCPDDVPIKYRKAFPGQFEDKYFRAGPFKRATPEVYLLDSAGYNPPSDIAFPIDRSVYKTQIEKMNKWMTGENAKNVEEIQREAKARTAEIERIYEENKKKQSI